MENCNGKRLTLREILSNGYLKYKTARANSVGVFLLLSISIYSVR